jgi:hypothetical protein
MTRVISLLILSFFPILFLGCTTTKTESSREVAARPRVEQRALSNAMELAFKNVDFSMLIGKKVYIETYSLSRIDINFISGFVGGRVIEKGGFVVSDEKNAQIKLFNVVKVSGTDEIIRKILPDKVRGEYRGTLSMIDLTTSKTIKTYELFAEADENR